MRTLTADPQHAGCDLHNGCTVTVTYLIDDDGNITRHREHDLGNGTGSQTLYDSEGRWYADTLPMPEHFVIYDGGDPLDRFVLRCACGFEATFFSYTAAARAMDGHLGLNFIPVSQRKVTAEQVSA